MPTSCLTVTARASLIGRRPPPSVPVSASPCLLSTTASNATSQGRTHAGEDTGELARYVALVAAAAAVRASSSELAAHCTRRARRNPCADDDSSSAISVMCSILRFRQPSAVLLELLLSSDAPRPRPTCILGGVYSTRQTRRSVRTRMAQSPHAYWCIHPRLCSLPIPVLPTKYSLGSLTNVFE